MKPQNIDRRYFLKTSIVGAALAGVPIANSTAQESIATDKSSTSSFSSKRTTLAEARPGTLIRPDMSNCSPAENFALGYQKDRWQLDEFETTEGVKGFMASARPDHSCGKLTLPLEAQGLYRIYLGIHATKSHYRGSSSYGQIEVKLTDDKGFRRVGPEDDTEDEDGTTKFGEDGPSEDKIITEAYWKTAELKGQSLTFRQMPYPYNRPEHARIGNLTYVRLVPLNEKEKLHWRSTRPGKNTRNLALIFCTGQYTGHTRGTYTFHPSSKDWFKDEFEPFANSDIGLLIFEAVRGSSCVYKTSIGSLGTKDNVWQEDWVDPLRELTRLAHGNGMKIFASMRFIGVQFPMNVSPIAWAPFYWKHREWTMRSKEGIPITKLSLAYPEVRQYWLSLLRETLTYGTDGLQLHLNRSEPYVFYEEPVVRAFQEKYGDDPRKLPVDDPRWLEHSASYLTQFIREIRALLDEKPERNLGVTLSGRKNGNPAHYEENHCDVETWIRNGLVNYIMVTPDLHPTLLKRWRSLGGDKLHIWPDLMPRSQTAASYARLAKQYYKAGADGLCLWDGERRSAKISEWAAVQQLGHVNQLDQLIKDGPSYYRWTGLKTLGGFDVKWSFKDG
ncbi:MAG: family 10 glycosylhydrolase [Verrucomicrobia bacterium]|nr:family 10 glycosylhydrolase [Verrucomicrobiota bacterium]